MTTKKGQGLSLNTIIIAIIVLIVLVVLVMIFTGYFGKIFTPAVKSCATQGGACVAKCNEGSYGSPLSGTSDCPTGTACCSKVSESGFGFKAPEAESCGSQKGSCQTLVKKADGTAEVCNDKGAYSGPITATGCLSTQVCCK